MFKNVASQIIAVFAWDTSADTWKTADAGNITAQLSKDAGACAPTNDVNPTELDPVDAPGVYIFDMLQAETNGDHLCLFPKSATANIKLEPIMIYTVSAEVELSSTAVDLIHNEAQGGHGGLAETLGATVADIITTLDATLGTDALPKISTDAQPLSGSLSVNAAAVGDKTGYSLAAGAIQGGTYDAVGAFPVTSVDSGATAIARVGADSDTLETLSDQIDLVSTAAALSAVAGNVTSILADTNETQGKLPAGNISDVTTAQVNTEVDNALNTAVPGFPTAGSINERVKAIDDKLPTDYIMGSTTLAAKNAAIDSILVDTGTTLDGKLDTVVADAAAILVDTGTTLDGKINTIDGIVDAILVDTGTTLDGKINTIDGIVDAILVDTAEMQGKLPAGTISDFNEAADGVNVTKVEGVTLQGKVGDNLDIFFHNANLITSKTVDDVGGGSGVADWTANERAQIRQGLGVSGATLATTGAGVTDLIKVATDKMNFTGTYIQARVNDKGVLNDISTADVLNQAGAALIAARLHELMVGATSGTYTTGSIFDDMLEDNGGVQRFTALALSQAPSGAATLNDNATNKLVISKAIKNYDSSGVALTPDSIMDLIQDNIDANEAKIDIGNSGVAAIKAKTDLLAFNSGDVLATLDGELVDMGALNGTPATAFTQFMANVSNLDTTVSSRAAEAAGNLAAVKAQTDKLQFGVANDIKATLDGETVTASSVTDKTGYSLAADAITASVFDETTAWPVTAADTGATRIARVGGAGTDTLDTLSDQIDTVTGHVQHLPEAYGKAAAGGIRTFEMRDETDGYTLEPGKTVTCQRSLDGAAWEAMATGTATEIGSSGSYYVAVAAGDTNCDDGEWRFVAAGCRTIYFHFKTYG